MSVIEERADKIMTDRGMVTSRSQAKSMIDNGDVTCNGVVLKKAGAMVPVDSEIVITAKIYVGRGAFKLEGALKEFNIPVDGLVMLDVGASTGGFTEVMLNNGAQKVYAIDVGHDQLAAKLRQDPRVINMEGINIRELNELPELADGAVMDLSFISITKVLENVAKLLKPKANLVALIKPQFEAGKERVPSHGVIRDEKLRKEILREVLAFAESHGWKTLKVMDSPIEGKTGNLEFLVHWKKN